MSILKTIIHFGINPPLVNVKEVCLTILVMLFAVSTHLQAQTSSQEYQVNPVFLFNFTQFVEWPDAAFPKENSRRRTLELNEAKYIVDDDETSNSLSQQTLEKMGIANQIYEN